MLPEPLGYFASCQQTSHAFHQTCVVRAQDLAKAKKVAHRKRKNRRYSEFAPYDATIAKAIPGTADAAEVSRVGIRSTYATMQTEIDACSTADEIYAILQKYPSRPIPPEANMNLYQRINDDGSSAELML